MSVLSIISLVLGNIPALLTILKEIVSLVQNLEHPSAGLSCLAQGYSKASSGGGAADLHSVHEQMCSAVPLPDLVEQ